MLRFRIRQIIKVVFENDLLELHFNITNVRQKLFLSLCISDDGETITFDKGQGWIKSDDIIYEIYSPITVDKYDILFRLIGNKIRDVKYGIGKILNTDEHVIYYFRMRTEENDFLFFNNGDEGAFSFENIEEILAHDIYGYQWVDKLPTRVG